MSPKKKAESKPKAAAKPKAASKPKAGPKVPKTPTKTTTAKKTQAPKAEKAVKVAVTSKTAPVKPAIPASSAKKFPRKGETQMLAFVRDPQCVFTYWEVTPESVEAVKRQLQDEFKGSSMVLRVFHVGGPDGEVQLLREIFVGPDEMNRYIDIDQRSGRYFFEIAQKAASGRLAVYVRSNPIQMGHDPYSAPTDSGASQGSTAQMPSGLQEYYSHEEYTETFLTPGGPSSMDSLRRKKGRYAASHTGPRT
jgi:hypothetical protein